MTRTNIALILLTVDADKLPQRAWKGQNLGQISATMQPQQDTLKLTGGVIDTGNAFVIPMR
ncbi:hypothetical protein CE195_09135 [Sodalis-like symbiont of Philaenus spumarius]|nr:hypothetical protein CE195_09135 [Sodalis-like symbiont of Philaenus spumarius]